MHQRPNEAQLSSLGVLLLPEDAVGRVAPWTLKLTFKRARTGAATVSWAWVIRSSSVEFTSRPLRIYGIAPANTAFFAFECGSLRRIEMSL
jgi:hypothetical protein